MELPLELFEIIGTYCKFKTQVNLKHTCNRFYHNLILDKNYLTGIQTKTFEHIIKQTITQNDLIRYMVQENGLSITKVSHIINSIAYTNQIKSNCVHTPTKLHGFMASNYAHTQDPYRPDIYSLCQICNLEYYCHNCYLIRSKKEHILKARKNKTDRYYCKIKCYECSNTVMAYICNKCNLETFNCTCKIPPLIDCITGKIIDSDDLFIENSP